MIRITDQQFWLYTAVYPQITEILHLRLFSTTTTELTERSLKEYGKRMKAKPPYFSLLVRNTTKLYSIDLASYFRQTATEL